MYVSVCVSGEIDQKQISPNNSNIKIYSLRSTLKRAEIFQRWIQVKEF